MRRNQLIKLIHVAKRELRLDDDTYRALLISQFDANTIRGMDISQLKRVLDIMKQLGFKIKPTSQERLTATDEQSRKIRAIWLEMADAGFIRDRSERALNKYVFRVTGIGRLDWLSTSAASNVIETLKKWQSRELDALAKIQEVSGDYTNGAKTPPVTV